MWETRQKHWRPYVDICKICSIDWDFIGKTEHFEQDHNYMFEKLGILVRDLKLEKALSTVWSELKWGTSPSYQRGSSPFEPEPVFKFSKSFFILS